MKRGKKRTDNGAGAKSGEAKKNRLKLKDLQPKGLQQIRGGGGLDAASKDAAKLLS